MAAVPEPLRLFESRENNGTRSVVTNQVVGAGFAALQAVEQSAKKVRQTKHSLEQAIEYARTTGVGWRARRARVLNYFKSEVHWFAWPR